MCVRACCDHQQGGRRKLRGGLRLREEGAPAERGTAREAGKILKWEKSSALENNFYTVAEGENFRERASLGRNILKSEKNSALRQKFSRESFARPKYFEIGKEQCTKAKIFARELRSAEIF